MLHGTHIQTGHSSRLYDRAHRFLARSTAPKRIQLNRSAAMSATPARGPVTLVSFGMLVTAVISIDGWQWVISHYLLLSDVDGTLIESIGTFANRLHKEAFAAGFKQVFGLDTHIDVIKHHGSTDPLIVVSVLEHHGVPKEEAMEKLSQVEKVMTEYFLGQSSRASEGLGILPGVLPLLQKLQARDDVATCLVTGNLEPIGWGKMKALGVFDLFTQPCFGGFGSDFCSGNTLESWKDRAELVSIAAKKCEALFPGDVKARLHVGDTPMDIQAAVAAGAQPIGVATGIYSKEQLAAVAKEAVVLDNLANLDHVLETFGLS